MDHFHVKTFSSCDRELQRRHWEWLQQSSRWFLMVEPSWLGHCTEFRLTELASRLPELDLQIHRVDSESPIKQRVWFSVLPIRRKEQYQQFISLIMSDGQYCFPFSPMLGAALPREWMESETTGCISPCHSKLSMCVAIYLTPQLCAIFLFVSLALYSLATLAG